MKSFCPTAYPKKISLLMIIASRKESCMSVKFSVSTNVNMQHASNDYVTCCLSFGLLKISRWRVEEKRIKMSQKVVREDHACSFKHKLRENFTRDKSSLRKKMHIWLLCARRVWMSSTSLMKPNCPIKFLFILHLSVSLEMC